MSDQAIDFYRREICPGCGSENSNVLYQLDYADDRMRQFIESFYQQRVDYRLLQNAIYEIAKCPRCGLLFQRNVLNQAGQAALYGEWVDNRRSHEKNVMLKPS